MPTNKLERKYYFIYTALIFLALGLMTSPTVVAGYHIFIVIPALLLCAKNFQLKNISHSSWLLLLFTAWGLVSAFYNLDNLVKPGKSFGELKYYFLGVLCIFPLQEFFSQAKERHFKILLNILCVTIILAFFVGISKAWFGFNPVKMNFGEYHDRSGGFVNYMRYGYGSALLFLIGLGIFFNREKLKGIITPKIFYPALVLCLAAVATSQTRGALLALIGGIPFILLKYKPTLAKVMICIGLIFGSIVIYFSFISQSTKYRFININQSSTAVRVSQWQTATKAIAENPIVGLGPDQFSYHAKDLKKKYKIKYKYYGSHAHNIFLEHGANYGIVGMLMLLLFFIFWFIEMIKLRSDIGWISASYIVAFILGGQVELLFDVINSHILFFMYSFSQFHLWKKAGVNF